MSLFRNTTANVYNGSSRSTSGSNRTSVEYSFVMPLCMLVTDERMYRLRLPTLHLHSVAS